MKNLLAGEQQAAVTVAVESLMDNKPETEATFATLDPKVTPQCRSIPHLMHFQASCDVKFTLCKNVSVTIHCCMYKTQLGSITYEEA